MIAARLHSTPETLANPAPADKAATRAPIEVSAASITRLAGGDVDLFLRTTEGTGHLRVPSYIAKDIFVPTNSREAPRAHAKASPTPEQPGVVLTASRSGKRLPADTLARYERVLALRKERDLTWRAAAKIEDVSSVAVMQWHYGQVAKVRRQAAVEREGTVAKLPVMKPSGEIL